MHKKEVEELLNRISSQEPLYLSENDFRIIEQMVDESLIQPHNGGYSLTDYGRVIETIGYDNYKKEKSVIQFNHKSFFSESLIILLAWVAVIISILSCVFYLSS